MKFLLLPLASFRMRMRQQLGRFEREADIDFLTGSASSVAIDPKQSFKAPHSPTTKC